MGIFRKESNKTSNEYYDLYKEELRTKESNDGFFSLKTIVKLETATIIAGILFMSYSNFFSDFSKNFSIEVNTDIFKTQTKLSYESQPSIISDLELMVQLEESEPDTVEAINIEEEHTTKELSTETLAGQLNKGFDDLSLIVEIIKSDMITPNSISRDEESILIGQL
jgi:hypothetical protein